MLFLLLFVIVILAGLVLVGLERSRPGRAVWLAASGVLLAVYVIVIKIEVGL
jgi:hypothetical protein